MVAPARSEPLAQEHVCQSCGAVMAVHIHQSWQEVKDCVAGMRALCAARRIINSVGEMVGLQRLVAVAFSAAALTAIAISLEGPPFSCAPFTVVKVSVVFLPPSALAGNHTVIDVYPYPDPGPVPGTSPK